MSLTKPIQEQIFKSRLTITYRTNITGTVQQERLPYRLLVLGEFEGSARRAAGLLPDLAKRGVRSIKRGTTVDDHLAEIVPVWRIPAEGALAELRSKVPGKITFDHVHCSIPLGAIERGESKRYALSGTASFESTADENGLCPLSGALKVGGTIAVKITNGVAEAGAAEVYVTGAVGGDYRDPATNKVIGVVTAYIHEPVSVAEKQAKMAPHDELEDGDLPPPDAKGKPFVVMISGPQTINAERTVPIQSMASFTPDAIAASIPELHRLQVIKQLLVDLQSGLRNRPELRKQMKNFLPGYGEAPAAVEQKLTAFVGLKEWAEQMYPLLKIEQPHGAPRPETAGRETAV